MRTFSLLAVALQAAAFPVLASAQTGDYYVVRDTLAEMSAPGSGTRLNRIYRGQKVTVYSVSGRWARVTDLSFDPRWVELSGLSRKPPAPKYQKPVATNLRDPRIAKDAIPKVGENGLTQRDVDLLWRGANHFLKNGTCARVEYGDKSTSRAGAYYVNCGGRNVFFTERDLRP